MAYYEDVFLGQTDANGNATITIDYLATRNVHFLGYLVCIVGNGSQGFIATLYNRQGNPLAAAGGFVPVLGPMLHRINDTHQVKITGAQASTAVQITLVGDANEDPEQLLVRPQPTQAGTTLTTQVFSTVTVTGLADIQGTLQVEGPAHFKGPIPWFDVTHPTYGAIGDGVHDDTAAILGAIAACGVTGGIVYLPPGTYKVSSVLTINKPNVWLMGAGRASVTLKPTNAVNGDVLRIQMSPFSNLIQASGPWEGFTIDGSSAAAGAVGLHYGDVVAGRVDIRVTGFSGAGSIGVWFDNRTNWTEGNRIDLQVDNCTTCILFDVNGAGTNSFDYNWFNLRLGVALSMGVKIQNTAVLGHGTFVLIANLSANTTLLQITGTASLGFTGVREAITISVEAAGAGVTGLDIAVGAALTGVGVIDCAAGAMTNTQHGGVTNVIFVGSLDAPGIKSLLNQSDAAVSFGGHSFFSKAGNYRFPFAASDNNLVGIDLSSNSVLWHIDHRGALNGPNNLEIASGGSSPFLRIGPNGNVGTLVQLYPGDETTAQQVSGGLLHAAAVPANANGNNNDWAISDNGHVYFKTAGAWAVKV